MTKRSITKLFAVGALAISAQASASPDQPTSASKPRTLPNGRPACGNVMTKGPRPPCVETATPAPAAAPRTLQTGAPACGNVNSKSYDEDCAKKAAANARAARVARAVRSRADALMVTAAAGAAVVQPRVLASGAPACGNVVRGKSSSSVSRRPCRTEALLTVPASSNDLVARIAATSAETYLAAITSRGAELPGRAATPAPVIIRTRTDGGRVVITPRMLAHGAPACGNVLGKVNSDKDPAYQACIIENQPGPMTAQRAIDIASVWGTDSRPAIDVAVRAIENYQPRELANGAPACGNVASRAPRPCKTIAANAK